MLCRVASTSVALQWGKAVSSEVFRDIGIASPGDTA